MPSGKRPHQILPTLSRRCRDTPDRASKDEETGKIGNLRRDNQAKSFPNPEKAMVPGRQDAKILSSQSNIARKYAGIVLTTGCRDAMRRAYPAPVAATAATMQRERDHAPPRGCAPLRDA
ncbi:hypothetical protein Maq22A_1p32245 (plasmid) [Methylobacterium aquaticum]|uniref:Uncharacterized protein n=1 Tax=Methylobacterium aquaticum TaxID=270351 RepID=A0A0C6FK04_9HYPH|nr:hypothetical protein Maq22A_1p32245 [Methylobacterium aquaticum]